MLLRQLSPWQRWGIRLVALQDVGVNVFIADAPNPNVLREAGDVARVVDWDPRHAPVRGQLPHNASRVGHTQRAVLGEAHPLQRVAMAGLWVSLQRNADRGADLLSSLRRVDNTHNNFPALMVSDRERVDEWIRLFKAASRGHGGQAHHMRSDGHHSHLNPRWHEDSKIEAGRKSNAQCAD